MRRLLQSPRLFLLCWSLAFFVALRFLRNVSFSYQAGSVLSPESIISTSETEAADEKELLSQHLVENARECVFDDLARSYYPKYNPDIDDDDDDETCWHLEWEYLQIPASAILNRHQLSDHRLGNGKAGAAYRALIHLPGNSNEGIHSACYAVLKSDLCQDKNREMGWWRKILKKETNANDNIVPCVADNALFSFNTGTFLKGEITGMLLHYSYHRRNLTLPPGLMPTWAVVVQPRKLQKAWWWPRFMPSRIAFGYPAEDPDVVGVILPLRKFAGVWDLYWPVDQLPHEPSEVARTMLPAAQGLEIMHSLGLVHQDIGTFNLALYRGEGNHQSILYDYGLMAAGLVECSSLEMCDYCLTQHIGQRRSYHRQVEGLSFAESDVVQFARVLAKYMVDDEVLQELLLECRTASQLAGLLEDWSTVRNDEEEE